MTSPTDLAQLYILLSYEKVRVEGERQEEFLNELSIDVCLVLVTTFNDKSTSTAYRSVITQSFTSVAFFEKN